MSSEEEEVPLIVKRNDLTSAKLRLRGEKSTENAANSVSEQGGKVVQNQLGCKVSSYSKVCQSSLRECAVALAWP